MVIDQLKESLPAASQMTFDGSGHVPHISHSERYIEWSGISVSPREAGNPGVTYNKKLGIIFYQSTFAKQAKIGVFGNCRTIVSYIYARNAIAKSLLNGCSHNGYLCLKHGIVCP